MPNLELKAAVSTSIRTFFFSFKGDCLLKEFFHQRLKYFLGICLMFFWAIPGLNFNLETSSFLLLYSFCYMRNHVKCPNWFSKSFMWHSQNQIELYFLYSVSMIMQPENATCNLKFYEHGKKIRTKYFKSFWKISSNCEVALLKYYNVSNTGICSIC